MKERIEALINEGIIVKMKNFVHITEPGLIMPDYISGEEYDMWMNKIKIFTSRYCKEHILYNEIMEAYNTRHNSWGTGAYDKMMSYLKTLLNDDEFINADGNTSSVSSGNKSKISEKMIFISHSSLDVEYVTLLVSLLEDIGLKGRITIFCSSVSGYGIPNGRHIYDYLKEQFNKDLHVIFLLSENYYSSAACLNEMGAAWVKSKSHTAILTPEFTFSQIRGAIDASKIWFRSDDKFRLNDYKEEIIGEFDLPELENSYWERKRDKYLEDIKGIYESNKYKTYKQAIEIERIEGNEENLDMKCYFRFINKNDHNILCTYLEITAKDHNGGTINMVIPSNLLENTTIFNGENKRVVITVPSKYVKTITSINPHNIVEHKIDEVNWSRL